MPLSTDPPATDPHTALVWFRRDLRCHDHAALAAALARHRRVWCVFVFDTEILGALADREDRRVAFIHASVLELDARLRAAGGGLLVRHGPARRQIVELAHRLGAGVVYAARDYEPQAVARDALVERELTGQGRRWVSVKDQVIFERDEILTATGTPYSVFTPYRRAWERRLTEADWAERRVDFQDRLAAPPPDERIPDLEQLGFATIDLGALGIRCGATGGAALLRDFADRIEAYGRTRDFPAVKGPSYLSVHLRFGTVSARELVRLARGSGSEGAAVWLSELIWREFYMQILHHHPRVAHAAFRPAYDRIAWEQGPAAQALFEAWCQARTGYPLIDAAMTQLGRSGYMHNRLRMVTASFLVKDLGIDWRWGEAHFARRLIDFDLAANNGGWQWASSSGCDAQPWFRIFNPITQSKKFDPQGRFIRRYLPALANLNEKSLHAPWLAAPLELSAAGIVLGRDYPRPIVDHEQARARTLARFAVVKDGAAPAPRDDEG